MILSLNHPTSHTLKVHSFAFLSGTPSKLIEMDVG